MLRFAFLCVAALASKPPHLVMMVLDDVGWADVGYHGSDFPTPNIDRLAMQGLRLEKYYVQQVCSPTRSALMTGRYPFHTGMQHCTTLMPGSSAKLPEDVPTIAETLRAAGYSTAAIGKWHLGYDSWDATPTGRGFDSWAGYLQGQTDYYNKTVAVGTMSGVDFWRNRTCAWEETAENKYSMDFYMREAERLLDERQPEKPLFLYFAHQQLHIPLEGPREPEYAEECSKHIKITDPDGLNRHTLCTMMNRLDRAIGDFEQMLKQRGLWENTLIWVTTDNGGMTQYAPDFPRSASSNFPLRGGKTTLFEGGVRGVSFLTGGLLPANASGKEYSGLLQHVDISETMAHLAGTQLRADGVDVWSAITSGGPSPRTEAPLNVDVSRLAKLCTLMDKPNEPTVPEVGRRLSDRALGRQNYSAIIHGDWKLINGYSGFYDGYWSNGPYLHTEADFYTQGPVKMGGEVVWLFDLQKDPEERRNVAATNPTVVARLQARLLELAEPAAGYRDPQDNVPSLRALPSHHNGTWAPWKRSKVTELLV